MTIHTIDTQIGQSRLRDDCYKTFTGRTLDLNGRTAIGIGLTVRER